MQAQEENPLSLEELFSWAAEILPITKTIGVIRSSSAIVSLISSSILIWIMNRSNARFSSIYHRMLLGMSVGDIFYSLSLAHFNSAAPSDVDYYVWNARGNQATCSAQGFVAILAATISVYYTCSLNLYSLAVVKYNKTNTYIRTKIEPFLHGVPIVWGFIFATTKLAEKNDNDTGSGNCVYPVYNPPHCIGYDVGEVREGFDIPCGRGRDGAVLFVYVAFFVTFCVVPPIIIGMSFGMIYRAAKQQEQANLRYGVAAFTANANSQHTSSGANGHEDEEINHLSWLDRRKSTIRSAVSSLHIRRSSSTSNSRVVLHRAFAFTISYFLTWSFFFISACFNMANKDTPQAIWYLTYILGPLQGFFNLCVYLQPKVSKNKSRAGSNATWCQAVMEAIWYSGSGDQAPGRGGGRGGGPANREHQPREVANSQ